MNEARAGITSINLLPTLGWLRQQALELAPQVEAAADGAATMTTDLLLLVCAIEQVLADAVGRGGLDLTAVRRRTAGDRAGAVSLRLERWSGGLVLARRRAFDRELMAMLARVRGLALELGTALATGESGLEHKLVERALEGTLSPELDQTRPKVPICFHGVDLTPGDCFELAERFAAASGKLREVVVVGIRTSGSYMAPLCAGWLRGAGWVATYTTVRPSGSSVRMERRAWLGREAEIAVIDDPPVEGTIHAATAEHLLREGVDRDRLTLLVPRIWEEYPGVVDASLSPYRSVQLAPDEPELRRAMFSDEIAKWVAGLAGGGGSRARPVWSVSEVTTAARRHHVRQRFDVPGYGEVMVKGVGLGWLGNPARAAGERLTGRVPEVLGQRPGLMALRWVEGRPVRPGCSRRRRYVAARMKSLPVAEPPAPPARWRKDAWDQAARLWPGHTAGWVPCRCRE